MCLINLFRFLFINLGMYFFFKELNKFLLIFLMLIFLFFRFMYVNIKYFLFFFNVKLFFNKVILLFID